MSALFGFIFIIIIAILVFGLSIINSILRFIFGFGKKSTSSQRRYTSENQAPEQEELHQAKQSKPKKIFDKNDGEYVDFEEIKDDKH